ncbi:MAG: helix-turn-helix transcriptional regulator [Vicinamibacterales bacterium]
MKPHDFQILLALAEEPRHGSGIVRAVLDQTAGALRLWPVKLYAALESLAEEGLIEALPDRERPPGASARRHYYRPTRAGRQALAAEADRLAHLADTARTRLARRQRSRS